MDIGPLPSALTAAPPRSARRASALGPARPATAPAAAEAVTWAIIGKAAPTVRLSDPSRDLQQSANVTRQRFESAVLPKPTEPSPYGRTESESLHPNEYTFYWRGTVEPLEKAIKDNKALVATARAGLEAGQRIAFDKLWKLAADDIGAQAALQLLLLEGTLTTAPSSGGSHSLLDELTQLADRTQPIAKGLERDDLVNDLIQEIAFPSSISQRHRRTCTVTAAQIHLARVRPAEYARIVRELAAEPNAPVQLAAGLHLQREPGTETADDSKRTQSSRLFQAAAMETMFPDADYDNVSDQNILADGQKFPAGNMDSLAGLMQGLLGPDSYVSPRWQGDFAGPGAFAEAIIAAAKAGHPTLVALYRHGNAEDQAGGAGHQVLVIEATDSGVRYVNPWGQIETTTAERLGQMTIGAVFMNAKGTEPPSAFLSALPQD